MWQWLGDERLKRLKRDQIDYEFRQWLHGSLRWDILGLVSRHFDATKTHLWKDIKGYGMKESHPVSSNWRSNSCYGCYWLQWNEMSAEKYYLLSLYSQALPSASTRPVNPRLSVSVSFQSRSRQLIIPSSTLTPVKPFPTQEQGLWTPDCSDVFNISPNASCCHHGWNVYC